MRSLDGDALPLGLIAQNRQTNDRPFFLLNESLELIQSDEAKLRSDTWKAAAPDPSKLPIRVDGQSVLVEEDGRRYRLPLSPGYAQDKSFGEAIGFTRRAREVATERDLLNVAGTVYELPARNAGGFAHIRPIASHPFRIHDFCSWRGMFLMTGIDPSTTNKRVIMSPDRQAAVWVGVVDELWQMGKARGIGGPWTDSLVRAGEVSDPYLMYGYGTKSLKIKTNQPTEITIQIDPTGAGDWHDYKTASVSADKYFQHSFPIGFNAHWIRFVSDATARVSTVLTYE